MLRFHARQTFGLIGFIGLAGVGSLKPYEDVSGLVIVQGVVLRCPSSASPLPLMEKGREMYIFAMLLQHMLQCTKVYRNTCSR